MIKHRRTRAGFSLIEVAIVLVVIGLLLSGGLLAISPVVEQSKVSETKAKMARIEAALQAHVIANQCLPCPALATRPSTTDASAGLSEIGGTGSAATCGTCDITETGQGVVPWRNIGLSEADVTDSFGNRIAYAADHNLCTTNSMVRSVSTYPATANLVINGPGGTAITSVGVYVLISFGPDGSYANAAETGTAKAIRNNSADQLANSNGTPFNMLPKNSVDGGANFFDDIVAFKTVPNVIQGCGAGSCGNPS